MDNTDKNKAIYYIKDIRNDKVIYIGQTKNFNNRKKSHFTHRTQPIDLYMYEEGRENFEMNMFTDIDYVNMTEEEMLQKENELIIYYNTINDGLNKHKSGLIYKNNINQYHREKNKEFHQEYRKTEYRKKYLKEYRKTDKNLEYQRKYQREYYHRVLKNRD